ncbi:acetyl-CoA carboxylase biotin carboxylase subunit family protein [Nocardia brasiliensis]|uniref:ATP-grasp domain-containing protein n=1 Tax=Nocardia brasiliensis TaxID=37326 RepID=UPI00366F57AB
MSRSHIALLAHMGYEKYCHADGEPFFDPELFDVTFIASPEHLSRVVPGRVMRSIEIDARNEEKSMTALYALKGGPRVDWIVATAEWLMLPAARIRDALGLPGFTEAQVLTLRDKVKMKRHFAERGIKTPEFIEIREPMDAAYFLAKHGAIIIKPVYGMESFDVHIVRDRAGLEVIQRRGFKRPEFYEAEEFIVGSQFHIDSVVHNGCPVTTKVSKYVDTHLAFPLNGQMRSHTVDAGPECEVLLEFNRRVLSVIDWFSGVAHLELFLDPDGEPVLCEIGGRPGGAGISAAFQHSHGASLHFASILPQIGQPVPRYQACQPKERQATGWSMVYPPAPGRFIQYGPLPSAEWLVELRTPYKSGDIVKEPERSTDALAVTTVCGTNAREVLERLQTVKNGISAVIEPYDAGFEPVSTGLREDVRKIQSHLPFGQASDPSRAEA